MTWTCMAHDENDEVCGKPTDTGAVIWTDAGRNVGNGRRVTVPLCEVHGPSLQRPGPPEQEGALG